MEFKYQKEKPMGQNAPVQEVGEIGQESIAMGKNLEELLAVIEQHGASLSPIMRNEPTFSEAPSESTSPSLASPFGQKLASYNMMIKKAIGMLVNQNRLIEL
jgi:hypothetical protein